VHYILDRLESDLEAAVIFNTNVSAEELLAPILQEFEIPRPAGSKADVLTALNAFLIERYPRRKRVLLIIDEGQNLSNEALEEVRMLSNLQSDNQSLLQIMLVGQPELIAKLKNPSMRQFSQRIAASYHYKLSGGIPRAIHLVCQAALVYGFAEEAQKIDQDTIHRIRKDNLGIGCEAAPAAACTRRPPLDTPLTPRATTATVSNDSWACLKQTSKT